MNKHIIIGLAAALLSCSALANGVDKLSKDLDGDSTVEEYVLKKEFGGKTLYVNKNGMSTSITKPGVMPTFYKLFKLKESNCIRVGAPNSDDFYDACYVEGKYKFTASPILE